MTMEGGPQHDPYRDVFDRLTPKPVTGLEGCVNEVQWRAFLQELMTSRLITKETEARFKTDYCGPRSIRGFQDQLVSWSLSEDEALSCSRTVLDTLNENMELLERSLDPLTAVRSFLQRVANCLHGAEGNSSRSHERLLHELDCRTTHAFPHRPTGAPIRPHANKHQCLTAWQFQAEHLHLILREEQRRKPLHLDLHPTDMKSRVVLLETFSPRLSEAHDITVSVASATIRTPPPIDGSIGSTTTELVVAIGAKVSKRGLRS